MLQRESRLRTLRDGRSFRLKLIVAVVDTETSFAYETG